MAVERSSDYRKKCAVNCLGAGESETELADFESYNCRTAELGTAYAYRCWSGNTWLQHSCPAQLISSNGLFGLQQSQQSHINVNMTTDGAVAEIT